MHIQEINQYHTTDNGCGMFTKPLYKSYNPTDIIENYYHYITNKTLIEEYD